MFNRHIPPTDAFRMYKSLDGQTASGEFVYISYEESMLNANLNSPSGKHTEPQVRVPYDL